MARLPTLRREGFSSDLAARRLVIMAILDRTRASLCAAPFVQPAPAALLLARNTHPNLNPIEQFFAKVPNIGREPQGELQRPSTMLSVQSSTTVRSTEMMQTTS